MFGNVRDMFGTCSRHVSRIMLRQDSLARILQSAIFLSQPGVFSRKFLARSQCATIWGCVLESSCFDMDAFWYYFNSFYVFLSVFSLCSAAMFGHHVRETCSGLSGGMFDWTLCSAGCSNVRNCSSFEFLCFELNVRMFVEHMIGSHFGSECSKSN